jgi:hypothetical protein
MKNATLMLRSAKTPKLTLFTLEILPEVTISSSPSSLIHKSSISSLSRPISRQSSSSSLRLQQKRPALSPNPFKEPEFLSAPTIKNSISLSPLSNTPSFPFMKIKGQSINLSSKGIQEKRKPPTLPQMSKFPRKTAKFIIKSQNEPKILKSTSSQDSFSALLPSESHKRTLLAKLEKLTLSAWDTQP